MDPLVGKVFDGRSRLTALIGEGRSSTVYVADELAANRPVALRLLHFQTPVESYLTLRHENVIPAYAGGQTAEGLVFLASELVRAPRLHQILATAGALPWQRSLEILVQVCNAIEAANAHGIHGRLTPEKIFIEPFDVVRVALSPRLPSGDQPARTHDVRTQVLELGELAYEMLTGELPEQNGIHPSPPSRLRPLPAQLNAVVVGCLHIIDELRHADISVVRDALLAVRASIKPAAAT